MAATERLYAQFDETSNELADIRERYKRMLGRVNAEIRAFAADHRCSESSLNRTIEYTADACTDLLDDAEGPAWRRKCRLENEIGDIEEADLRLSAPVVL